MEKSEYQKYLASREWALLKEAVKKRSGGLCERCKFGFYEQTHHLTYERIGNELLGDLLGICTPCHEFLSGKHSQDPAQMMSTWFYASKTLVYQLIMIDGVIDSLSNVLRDSESQRSISEARQAFELFSEKIRNCLPSNYIKPLWDKNTVIK